MAKEISTANPKINNLIRQIESGEVKIPPLQRPFVWKIDQIIALLESIYKDFPVGSILWWETNLPLSFERNIAGFKLPQKPENHPFYYVLDGQQRLSSLYGVFCTDRTMDDSIDEYKVDPNIFNISFDLAEKVFIHEKDKVVNKKYFDLKKLFDTTEYSNELVSASAEERKTIEDLYVKFTNYEIPIIITKKRDLEEVGFIFERVNNTGTSLDLFDLMVALTWTQDFHLQNEFKSLHSILEKKNFKGIKNKVILQCLSCILKNSSGIKTIISLKGQQIRDNIELLKESLKKAIDYLSTELSVKSNHLLPHAHQVVPLCYFFSQVNTPTIGQKKIINQWFWKTSFSDRFTESTDRHIDEDVEGFKKLINGSEGVFNNLKYSVTADQLKQTKFLRTNAYSRAFIVLLANQHPKNLINGVKIDIGEALSFFNTKEYHHVFPRNFLSEKGLFKEEVINSLCNFCIIPADSNKKISDRAPSDYFQNLIPKENYGDILESNILPIRKSIYENDNYETFLQERSKKIMECLDRQLV